MKTLAIGFFVLCTAILNAQNGKTPNQMEELGFLIGKWTLENFENKKDQGWTSLGKTQAIMKLEHNGRFVREEVKYITGFGEINMITHIGFDSRINSYKLSAMDQEYGLMDIYRGKWVENKLVFTNMESDVPIKTNDGKELFFRVTYEKTSDKELVHWVEGTTDKGNTWFPFSKSLYQKTD